MGDDDDIDGYLTLGLPRPVIEWLRETARERGLYPEQIAAAMLAEQAETSVAKQKPARRRKQFAH